MTVDAEEKREALRAWLRQHDLSPYSAARKAGISPGTIYNFLSGLTDSLSSRVMQRLAAAANSSVDSILTGTETVHLISVAFRVGTGGRMFGVADDEKLTLRRPAGISPTEMVVAALIDGDALHPIPAGWSVFFHKEADDPQELISAMAVVRYVGGGNNPVVRTIRRGSQPGLFTLQAFNGSLTEDVEIVTAHRIVSFAASEPE